MQGPSGPLTRIRVGRFLLSGVAARNNAGEADLWLQEQQFKVIGTRPIRHDGVDKVTGRAKYGADYSFPECCMARSCAARMRTRGSSRSTCREGAGAAGSISDRHRRGFSRSFPARRRSVGEDAVQSALPLDQHPGARQGRCMTAMRSPRSPPPRPHIAEEALAPDRGRIRIAAAGDEGRGGDGARRADHSRGPAQQGKRTGQADQRRAIIFNSSAAIWTTGFKAADYIVEREFDTAMVHQGYIEPHNALGIYSSDGHATIYCSTQGPFDVRIADRARARNARGQYQGRPGRNRRRLRRQDHHLPGAARAAAVEENRTPGKNGDDPGRSPARHAADFRLEDSKSRWARPRTAKSIAAEVWMAYEAGAFPGSPVGRGRDDDASLRTTSRNFLIDGYDVVVNRPKTAAYRAPGATNAAFASETLIDELAEKCGIDPIDFRIMNAVQGRQRADRRAPVQTHRLYRDLRGAQEQPALQVQARRA